MKLFTKSRLALTMTTLFSVGFNGMAAGEDVKCLGMTLAEPGEELLKKYDLPAGSSGPIITDIDDPQFFPEGMVPTKGCAFWIVEPQAKGMVFNVTNDETPPTHRPKSVREFAEAILACTIAPREYENLIRRTAEAARKRAEAMTDEPAQRERMLRIADAKVSPLDAGKWICRVVYNYPHKRGTMTTHMRMTEADLDRVRELLKKLSRQSAAQ